MSIKDLFDVRIKTFQQQHDNLTSASLGAESIEYIKEKQKLKDLYVPQLISQRHQTLQSMDPQNYIMTLLQEDI